MALRFVGRRREMSELLAGVEEAAAGRARVFLVAGEPGIGKTRLAEELCAEASAHGASAFWGRCWEGGRAPPYWPWVQILRAEMRELDEAALSQALGESNPHLAQLVPELRPRFPQVSDPPVFSLAESQATRFDLFDATARFLASAARGRVTVLVLDDLHAADRPSLLLLRFLVRALRDGPVFVLGTYREAEAGEASGVAEILGEIAEEGRRIRLRGVSEAEVARLTEEAAGGGAASGLAGALYEATAGNPFFVEETLRLLIAEGRIDKQAEDLPVPPTVRDTIRRRLGRLSPQCRDVLSTASIVGRETDATFLAALCGRSADDLPSALAEALSAGCMVEAPGAPGRYRFSHALIGQTLYEDLAASRQLHLHRRAGEVLESLHAADPDRRLAELAHHFYCAAAGEVAGKAVEYCTRAGEAAMSRLAYEEAVLLYERALHALELARLSDERGCCDLLLAKAEAQMTCGDTREARATFERAAEAAKRLRAPQSLARAALGFGTLKAYMVTNADPRLLSLLEHALVAIGEEESPLRATVLARLAYELVWAGCPDRCRRLAEQALGMARRVADPAALASALDAWHCAFLGGADPRELVAVASDLIRVAGDLGQRQLVWLGHVWRLHDFVELGDASAMLEEIETLRRMAEGSRQPFLLGFLGVARAMQALLEGRFETAERLAADYSTSSGPAFGQAALVRYFLHSWWARVEQGRLEEFEPLVRANLAQAPPEARFRLPLAFVYAELGRDAELRAEFEAIAAAGFAELPRDWSWLFSMALLSMICATLRDTPRARSLYGLLLTHESRVAVIPTAVLCLGSIAHHLGTLASTLERPDEAEAHLEHAITVHARLGARPWLARSRYELARTLLARGGPGDHERATTLLDQALEAASELGMKPLAAKAEAERGRIAVEYAESGSGPGASVAPQVARRDCLRRDGDHWTFVFEGQSILLKDSHGIRYIAALLRKPTTPLPSTELASAASDRSEEMAPPRSPERARVNVTRSIADSIRRIGETSPGLARYLRRTIRTGASCCYRPDVGISIEVAT